MAIADTTAIAAGTPRDRLTDTPLGIAATLTGGEKRQASPTSAGARQSRPLLTRCRASGAKRPSHLTAPLRQTPTPPNPRSPHASVGPTPVWLAGQNGRATIAKSKSACCGIASASQMVGAGAGSTCTAARRRRRRCRHSSTRVLRQPDRHRRDGGQKRPTSATNSVVPAIRPRPAAGHAEHSQPEPPKARSRPAPARDLPPQGPGWCAHGVWRGAREPQTPKATAEMARWTPACARGSLTDGPLSLS